MNRLGVNKPAAILLIVALELGILFAGQQANAAEKPGPLPLNFLAPLTVSGSLYSNNTAPDRLPTVWDLTIFDFLYGYTAQAYWARPDHNHKHMAAVTRYGHGAAAVSAHHQESPAPGGQTLAAMASASLYALSPPGPVLRL